MYKNIKALLLAKQTNKIFKYKQIKIWNQPNNPIHMLKQHKLTNSSIKDCIAIGLQPFSIIGIALSDSFVGISRQSALSS